jgi:hypothetical protein
VRKQDPGAFFAQRTSDWSGLIHKKHQHFNFAGTDAYIRALLWLAARELEFAGRNEGDPMIYGVND